MKASRPGLKTPKVTERDYKYDATTKRQRGHDNSHALVSSTRCSTAEKLTIFGLHSISSFLDRFCQSMTVVGSRICSRPPCDLIERLHELQQSDLRFAFGVKRPRERCFRRVAEAKAAIWTPRVALVSSCMIGFHG